MEQLQQWWNEPALRIWLPSLIGLLVAVLFRLIGIPALKRVTRFTTSTLDDVIFAALTLPITLSIVAGGIWYTLLALVPDPIGRRGPAGLMATVLVLVWSRAANDIAQDVLAWLSQNQERFSIVQPRTMPLFEISSKTLIYGSAVYFLLLAWNIDVTAWLASAGVAGLAIGFAAKDTLANLFAGLLIIADSPYKLGDYLVMDGTTRGRVTHIGLRSTRLLTRDDVEVTLPNSVMVNSQITNQSGGPDESMRVRCAVEVAYSSDLEFVRDVMMRVADAQSLLIREPPQRRVRVRFRSFEASGIRVEVLGWVSRPEDRGRAVDGLVTGIHRAFGEADIEIPFPQLSLHTVRPEDGDDEA